MHYLKISIVLLFSVFASDGFAQSPADRADTVKTTLDSRGFNVKLGDSVENIVFQLDDGSIISLEDLKGKVILLQFTASWCGVCREEMPLIESELWNEFKEDGLMVIGVDYDEPLKKIKQFKKQIKVTYPLALDPDGEIFSKFAGKYSGVTRNVVIDQNGKIIFLTRLFKRDEFYEMKAVIEQHLENN